MFQIYSLHGIYRTRGSISVIVIFSLLFGSFSAQSSVAAQDKRSQANYVNYPKQKEKKELVRRKNTTLWWALGGVAGLLTITAGTWFYKTRSQENDNTKKRQNNPITRTNKKGKFYSNMTVTTFIDMVQGNNLSSNMMTEHAEQVKKILGCDQDLCTWSTAQDEDTDIEITFNNSSLSGSYDNQTIYFSLLTDEDGKDTKIVGYFEYSDFSNALLTSQAICSLTADAGGNGILDFSYVTVNSTVGDVVFSDNLPISQFLKHASSFQSVELYREGS